MKYKPQPLNEKKSSQEKLARKIDELSVSMEKMRLAEYVQMLENPRRLLYINFLQGLSRGFGTAIGFTILAGIVLYFMQKIILINIPVIGEFIADVVEIVQLQLRVGGFITYLR
ncbi:MAG: hypothetical protein GX808_10355 [Syntrophomonadaceae bacterium]|nr:hypothetical protein [Syntrophomonadaceae bacterium]